MQSPLSRSFCAVRSQFMPAFPSNYWKTWLCGTWRWTIDLEFWAWTPRAQTTLNHQPVSQTQKHPNLFHRKFFPSAGWAKRILDTTISALSSSPEVGLAVLFRNFKESCEWDSHRAARRCSILVANLATLWVAAAHNPLCSSEVLGQTFCYSSEHCQRFKVNPVSILSSSVIIEVN